MGIRRSKHRERAGAQSPSMDGGLGSLDRRIMGWSRLYLGTGGACVFRGTQLDYIDSRIAVDLTVRHDYNLAS
jgi:hypothetical protein